MVKVGWGGGHDHEARRSASVRMRSEHKGTLRQSVLLPFTSRECFTCGRNFCHREVRDEN
jgi:hypothetical protein